MREYSCVGKLHYSTFCKELHSIEMNVGDDTPVISGMGRGRGRGGVPVLPAGYRAINPYLRSRLCCCTVPRIGNAPVLSS